MSSKLASGLPVAPWIFINNSTDASNSYADALSSLIPYSLVYQAPRPPTSSYKGSEPHAVSIWANSASVANQAANTARECQAKAVKRGCNMASISLCNDSTIHDFLAVDKKDWPGNQFITNVVGVPTEKVAQRILKWLCEYQTLQPQCP
jgi:hypothetical protein